MFIVVDEIVEAIQSLGYTAHLNVGQSYFRCNIGVIDKQQTDTYALGILVDLEDHYANPNVMEQYFLRPSILTSFGWNVLQVYTKDWYQNPQKVIERIKRKLENKEEPPVAKPEPIPTPPLPEPLPQAVSMVEIKEEKPHEETQLTELVTQLEEHSTAPEIPNDPLDLSYERYELVDDKHSKIWEVAQDGKKAYVRYGRIGTKGQLNLKVLAADEEAAETVEKMKKEKMKKGYLRV